MSLTTGNNSIDSLVYSSWNATAGIPVSLTYSFLTRVPSNASDDDAGGFRAMTATQQAAVRDALAEWAAVANITFTEVSANSGNLQFGTNTQSDSSAYAYLPETGVRSVTMYLNNTSSSNTVFTAGTYGPTVLVHEIGHMLGLKHPGDYDSTGSELGGPYLPAATDNGDYTQMSYNDPTSYAINRTFMTTPMLYDIQAIQYLYGANMSYHAGNDAYTFTNNIAPECIWDAGGADTLDFSACTSATIINLNAGTFSETASGLHNISIAYNVTIESAIAGSGGSTIYANAAGNTLTGGAGTDIFYEGAGSDTISGAGGQDTVVFTHAFASYGINRAGDTVTVTGDGIDSLNGVEYLRFSDTLVAVRDLPSSAFLNGTDGADRVVAPAGNVSIDSGAGLDTVQYVGVRNAYTVTAASDGFVVTSAAGETGHLRNVERVQFADAAVALDVYGVPGQIYRLYAAALDRAPDQPGIGTWIKLMDAGESLASVAQKFTTSDEFSRLYGQLDNGHFIAQLYQNALGRTYDIDGFNHWMALLDSGMTRGEIVVGFSESNELKAQLIGVMQNGIDYIPAS
ncbi:serralysin [Pseudoduganella flava]|nr:DUF4214 domain-containing protein [Pseudoduganella flava]TWI46505.1 serralysin [Pseudoduganella flava]